MQYLSQSVVVAYSYIGQSLVEAGDRPPIHFLVLAVPAMHLNDGGLVPTGIGIRGWTTECLGPVGSKPLNMLGVEAVAEGMSDYLVGHYPTMPGISKAAQAVVTTCRLEDSLHTSMIMIFPASVQDDCSREFGLDMTVTRGERAGARAAHSAAPGSVRSRDRERSSLNGFPQPAGYAASGCPNQVLSASASPRWVTSPTQATYPSGRINTAVGAVTTPIAGSSQVPMYSASIN